MGAPVLLPQEPSGLDVTGYMAVHDSAAKKLSRKTAPRLRNELSMDLAQAGQRWLHDYGSYSRDELVSAVLELRFPDITRARQLRAENTERNAVQ
ncbi:MAG: hypothetical protein JWM19_906 [Actinomycetia bacterium]|nr:hypothetical protein [Actinomycetes bacterium]